MIVVIAPTIIAIRKDSRVPAMTWEKTSWPKEVVPSRWFHESPAPGG